MRRIFIGVMALIGFLIAVTVVGYYGLMMPVPASEAPQSTEQRIQVACEHQWPGDLQMQKVCVGNALTHDVANTLAERQRDAEREAGIR